MSILISSHRTLCACFSSEMFCLYELGNALSCRNFAANLILPCMQMRKRRELLSSQSVAFLHAHQDDRILNPVQMDRIELPR
jgi:hypothetical protein